MDPLWVPDAPRLQYVALASLRLSPLNPREGSDAGITELAASVGSQSEPLMVQFPAVVERLAATQQSQESGQSSDSDSSSDQPKYEVLFGERRIRAAILAQWTSLWCLVYPPLDPRTAHDMRLRENFHRQPLTPLAEAAALQVLYLLENADRMDLGDLSRDILSSEIDGALRSRIAPLRDLLLGNGWSPTRPRVSWSEVLDRHGLDLEPGARKRRLRALSLDESLLTAVQAANLSMRAIEALGTLPVEAQHRIMAAVAVKSDVARMIRHIARMVKLKRYTLDEALEDAMASTGSPGSAEASRFSSYQNRLVADPSHFGDTEVPITSPTHSYDAFGAGPEDAMGDQVSAQGDGDARSSNGRNGVQHGRNLLEGRTNTAVTELLSLSNRVSALLQEIQESALELASGGDGNGITDKGVVTTLPSPWGGYVRTAILLLQGTIDEYSGRLSVP